MHSDFKRPQIADQFPRYFFIAILRPIFNALKKGIPKANSSGRYSIEGIIEEGITILMHITENGKITSAYPIFKP
jgi:hypothetical protein